MTLSVSRESSVRRDLGDCVFQDSGLGYLAGRNLSARPLGRRNASLRFYCQSTMTEPKY
jgi:hypothetical protein